MSVIQSIQEKYAKLMAVIIAIALIIFVVMLAFENGGNLFRGGNSTSVGKVNGKSIEYTDFSEKMEQMKANMMQQGYPESMVAQQAFDRAWEDEINKTILESEADKLGIFVGKKELGDILYGANPPEFLKQQFTDSATGMFDAQGAKNWVDQVLKLKTGNPQQMQVKSWLISFIPYLEQQRLQEKYTSLLANTAYVPKWLIEKENADKSQIATVSLVKEYYAAITDTTIKVTDKEIADYVSKHKDTYKQLENRSIAYVSFSALPSAADSLAAKTYVTELKPAFDTVNDVKKFLATNRASKNYYDSYINGKSIQIGVKDSIFRMPIGGVYGPYFDGNAYSIAKLLGTRSQPDTVKVRHILISTGQRDTATAKKLVDSIQTAIRNGSNFDSLCLKFSDDGGKNDQQTGAFTGGVYDNVYAGRMVPEFNDFIFTNPVGSKGVVKTEFGYHYIEVLSQKGNSPAYKIAYISRPIQVSQETENNALNEANQFAGDSRDQKSFDANVEKLRAKGINKLIANNITPTSFGVPQVGQSRTFVKNIFKADKGDVLDPERVGESYVVAIVTEVNEEGTMSTSMARQQVEPLLRNKKKAKQLVQKLGTPASLEAAAATLGNKPIEPIDSIRLSGQQTGLATSLSYEPKVLGAIFNPANKGKIIVVEGSNAVYVIRVDNVMAVALAEANVEEQRKAQYMAEKQRILQQGMNSPIGALREAATIKDKRNDWF